MGNIEMLKNKILSCLGGGVEKDPNFSNTVLLLHGDGTNGAQNNTFVDSSANNFTITRNGNVTQGTFSPFSKEPGKWGVSFDWSGDYLTPSASTSLNLGTGAFTIEAWINIAGSYSSYQAVYLCGPGKEDGVYFNNGDLVFYTTGVGAALRFGTIQQGVWTHIAATRDSSNNLRLFVNGVASAATTYTFNLNDNQPHIGANKNSTPGEFLNGAISNLRIVKGTALYTSNFTPPTAPLTAVAGTSLLCCQDNRFKDNSSNNFTLTPYGDVKVTPFSPFANSAGYSASVNGGSGYFPTPTTNGLKGSPSSAYAFGLNAFTCECWLFMGRAPLAVQNIGNSNNGGQMVLFGWADNSGDLVSWRTFFAITSSTGSSWDQAWLRSEQNDGKSSVNSILSTPLSINAWHHIAIVRPATNSPSLNVYVNGVLSCTLNITGANFTFGGTGTVQTVGWTGLTSYEYSVVGYVSSTRSVNGTALYTSNFTPPTAPVTAVANTSLLLNFTNAGIYDNTGMNNLETVGNAQVSTAQAKFGTGSAQFEGTNSYLLTSAISFPGDFTVETWAKINSYQPGPILQIGNYADGVWLRSTSGTECAINGVFITVPNYTTVFPLNTWHHVAITRASNVCRLFVNGIQIGSSITVSGIVNAANILTRLGSSAHAGNEYFNGWLDEYRVTKGVARYTANFTPPAQAFPNK